MPSHAAEEPVNSAGVENTQHDASDEGPPWQPEEDQTRGYD